MAIICLKVELNIHNDRVLKAEMLQAYRSSDLINVGLSQVVMSFACSSCSRQAIFPVLCPGILERVIFPSLSGLFVFWFLESLRSSTVSRSTAARRPAFESVRAHLCSSLESGVSSIERLYAYRCSENKHLLSISA